MKRAEKRNKEKTVCDVNCVIELNSVQYKLLSGISKVIRN